MHILTPFWLLNTIIILHLKTVYDKNIVSTSVMRRKPSVSVNNHPLVSISHHPLGIYNSAVSGLWSVVLRTTWKSAGVSSLRVPSAGVKCPSRPRLQLGLKLWFPQTQGGGVQSFEPKQVDSLLFTMIEFCNHGIQGTATWSQLSFVPPNYFWNDPNTRRNRKQEA